MDYWRKISGDDEQENHVELKHYEADPSKWYLNTRSKIFCSLASGLPNEIDFALRAATLLANSGQFDWIRDYRFIDLVLQIQKQYACICDLEAEELEKSKHQQERILGFHLESDFVLDKRKTKSEPKNIDSEDSELDALISSNPNLKDAKVELLESPDCQCWTRYWLETIDGFSNSCDTDTLDILFGSDLKDSEDEDWRNRISTNRHLPKLKERVEHRIRFIADLLHLLSFTCEEESHLFSSSGNPSQLIEECCVPVGTSCALLRYVALLIHCDDNRLRNIGWDILANVASVITRKCPLEMDEYRSLQILVFKKVISEFYSAEDSQTLCRSMEILSRIIVNGSDDTISLITRTLRQFSSSIRIQGGDLIQLDLGSETIPLPVRLAHLLTHQNDVYLVISVLEFCLCLSEQHPLTLIGQPLSLPQHEACSSISSKANSSVNENFRPLMKLLINLLSMDASKHFHESAFKSIRIIDDLNRVYAPISRPLVSAPVQQQAVVRSLTTAPAPPQQVRSSPSPVVDKNTFKPELHLQAGTKIVSYSNQVTSQKTNIPQVAQQNAQQASHLASIENNEQFATNWLLSAFNQQPSNLGPNKIRMKLADIFTEYIRTNSNLGRKQVLTMSSFAELIRRVFPGSMIVDDCVEGIIQKGVNAIVKTTVSQPVGISSAKSTAIQQPMPKNDMSKITVKTVQPTTKPGTPPPIANGPVPSAGLLSSPILKAQLSAPPKVSPPASNKIVSNETLNTVSSPSTPASVQQILIQQQSPIASTSNGAPSTNLIKTLLATKIRANAVTTSANTANAGQESSVVQSSHSPAVSSGVIQVTRTAPTSCNNQPRQLVPTLSQQHTIVIGSSDSNQINNPLVAKANAAPQTSLAVNQNQALVRALVSQANNNPQGSQQPQQQTIAFTQGGTSSPQQFFLVRVSNPSAGPGATQQSNSPIRLIVPASALVNSQSKPLLANNTQQVIRTNGSDVTIATSQVGSNPQTGQRNSVTVSTADGTLKQMLGINNNPQGQISAATVLNGSGHVSETVKSSPLLNVLLDKGRLPDGPKSDAQSNQIQIAQVNNVSQQQPKLLILSTKGPLPVNNVIHPNGQMRPQLISIPNGDIKAPNVQNSEQKTIIISTDSRQPLVNGNAQNHNVQIMVEPPQSSASEKKQKSQPEVTVKKVKNSSSPVSNPPAEKAKQVLFKTVSSPANGPIPNSSVVVSQSNMNSNRGQPVQQILITQGGRIVASPQLAKIQVPQPPRIQLQYTCEWNGCKRSFLATSEVFIHVFRDHFANFTTDTVSQCLWTATEGIGPGCKMPRPKLSLLTHILDFHCSDIALKTIAKRSMGIAANIPPPPVPAQHPGYAQNAALLAIKRHSVNYHETPPPPPSGFTAPLTISIRLTAALVLRNLAQKCPPLLSTLACHESYLSVVSILEGREESRTLAQTLAVISEKSPLKSSHLKRKLVR